MNLYSIGLAVSIMVCVAAFILLNRPRTAMSSVLLISGFSALGGLLCARLVYWFGALDFFIGRTHNVLSFFWWTDGGFSLFGAVAGAAGCAWLACRWLKEDKRTLDLLALPLLLLVAEGRLLEWTAVGMDFGGALESPAWLAVSGEYGGRLNVALIEALMMIAVAVGLIIRMRVKAKERIPLRDTLFLMGLCEALAISMRHDTYMMWGFVHQEQLYFYLLSSLMVILTGFEARKPIAGIISAFIAAGAIIFLEFALDGRIHVPFAFMREWADLFWYALFILALAAYTIYYFSMRRGAERKRAS